MKLIKKNKNNYNIKYNFVNIYGDENVCVQVPKRSWPDSLPQITKNKIIEEPLFSSLYI